MKGGTGMKKRFLSLLLVICLVVGLMPTAVFAAGTDTGKAIQLVDGGTVANIGGGQADNIYFGTYQQSDDGSGSYNIDPIKWRVLENVYGQLFLLSDQNLDVFRYHVDNESVTWEESTMRSWLNGYGASENTGGDSGYDYTSDNFIGTAFSEKEQVAIADTTVVNDDNPDYNTEGGNYTTDKILLLSIAEANNGSYFADNSSRIATNTAYVAGGGEIGKVDMPGGVGEAGFWWLRSPGSQANDAASVLLTGIVYSRGSYVAMDSVAVRPAFHLDLNSVLFTSAAAGGKAGDGELKAVEDYIGSEWKLTLLDETRNFAVTEMEVSGISGGTVTLNYSGAITGENEYISVIIADDSGVQYYGRIAQPTGADGKIRIKIPAALAAGTYTLYAFSEQYNGDYKTDYASAFAEVALTVEEAAAPGIDTGKAIQLVDSGTVANISGGQADNVYFGTYQQSGDGSGGYNIDPVKWRVLENAYGQLFLLSDQNLDVFRYHVDNESVTWEESTMRSWLNGYGASENTGGDSGYDYTSDNFIGTAFSEKEQVAIADTTVVNDDNPDYNTEGGNYTTDKILLLSIAEANNGSYFADNSSRIATNTAYVAGGGEIGKVDMPGGVGEAGFWWLRSPGSQANDAASVLLTGIVYSRGSYVAMDSVAVRPAFHLDLNSVLFTSAAAGGKSSGAAGADALTSVSDYAGNEWKLTLLDSGRNGFAANVNGQTNASAVAGGSVQITYSGAQTGDNEYVSALLCDSSGNVLYYGNIAQNSANGTAELNIPAGLAAGSYSLKVFSEQYNGDYKTDYASTLQEISLNVLSKEATPQAVFTATGDNSGTLSSVDATMKYSTDSGANWNDITGTAMDITGVTVDNGIMVYKPGDGTATADSDAQIITVTQAAQPAGIGKTDCTTAAQNDGTITGVDSTMEYKLSAASEWTSISTNTVAGLANGTYEVRVKANGTVLASAAVTVTIGEHTCVAQGDWQHDENEHWKLCACGAEVDSTAHTSGTATCTEKAVCDVCGSSYGAINPDNHTGEIVWTKTATAHSSKYSCCDAVVVAEEAHEWKNGVCAECGYECQHTGGTATCTEKAVCNICGAAYGEVNAANHTNLVKTEDKAPTCTEDGNMEYWTCDGCDKYFSDETAAEEIRLENTVFKATGHSYEDGKCTVCGEIDPEFEAVIIEGANGTWQKGTKDGLSFTSNAAYKHFQKVQVDGKDLDASNYTVKEGSTIVTLNAEYLETLSVGKHTLAVVSETGTAETEFTIKAAATDEEYSQTPDANKGDTNTPQTGDNSNMMLWIALLFVSSGILSAVTYRKKKQAK